MAANLGTDLDRLTAPQGDGAVLVWPALEKLRTLPEINRAIRQRMFFQLLDRPVHEILAPQFQAPPLVAVGHQPDFLHPGVWAKCVVADRLAKRIGGRAEFVVVDSDTPRALAISWPHFDSERWHVRSAVPFPTVAGRTFEQLPASTLETWKAFFEGLPETIRFSSDRPFHAFEEAFLQVFQPPHAPPMRTNLDYVEQWIQGVRGINRFLGAEFPAAVMVSRCFGPRPLKAEVPAIFFAAHLMLHADAFCDAYNSALSEFRRRRRIRGRSRPIPDLENDGERVEVPFWIWAGFEQRARLAVSRLGDDGIQIWAGSTEVVTLSRAALAKNPVTVFEEELGGWHIRPRALALTMYLRLFSADLFIHGVGGAKYDQITDDIIRRFFRVEPPPFACVSATLRLPMPAISARPDDRRARIRKRRELLHNPQRYIATDRLPPHLAEALAAREQAIHHSDLLRADSPKDRLARRFAFERIQRSYQVLSTSASREMENLDEEIELIEEQLRRLRLGDAREWFMALYPTAKLQKLMADLPFA